MKRTTTLRSVLAASLPVTLLAGCATCGPIEAAWYWIDTRDHAGVHLALLNAGKTPVLVHGVSSGAASAEAPDWPATARYPIRLDPGRLRIIGAAPGADPCRLPTDVRVSCTASDGVQLASVRGGLPNALVTDWLERCGPP